MATKSKTAAKANVPAVQSKSNLPANLDLRGMGATGMEGADRESFALPFLIILQKLSPQLDKHKPEYIKGAEEGQILNTANQETYDGEEGIIVLPVQFKRSFTEWGLREKGGGFRGEHAPDDPLVLTTKRDDRNREILPNGETQLVDTRMHGVILLAGETPAPALVTFSSTQIKKSKRWMSQMQELQRVDNLPTFAHAWKLKTVAESNDRGSWMGWSIEPVGTVSEQEHVDAAIAFYRALQSGSMKIRADAAANPEPQ